MMLQYAPFLPFTLDQLFDDSSTASRCPALGIDPASFHWAASMFRDYIYIYYNINVYVKRI